MNAGHIHLDFFGIGSGIKLPFVFCELALSPRAACLVLLLFAYVSLAASRVASRSPSVLYLTSNASHLT